MLTADITTLPKRDTPIEVISKLGAVEGTSVSIPWLDSRTATVPDISMYNPAIEPLMDTANWRDKTLEVALRVRYMVPQLNIKQIAFWGVIHAPTFDYDTGKVTINAKDPTLKLSKAITRKGDSLMSPGYTLDGRGALDIVNAGQNTDAQDDLGWPSLGIDAGFDTSTPVASDDLIRKALRGDFLWTLLKELAALQIGPDFEFEPFETDPASLATGSQTDNTDQAIPNLATTDYTLATGLPGIIEGFRVGVYITHNRPSDLDLWVVHPDGTVIQLYDGTKAGDKSSTFGPAFGTAESALAFFRDFGKVPYGTSNTPDTWPKTTGNYKAEDSLLSQLADKAAAGGWKLRIRDRGNNAGGGSATLEAWSLRFQLPDPAFVRLNLSDKPSEDPDMDAVFYDGLGPVNSKIRVEPVGESVVNWSRFGSGKGKREAIRRNNISRALIGNMQNWTTTAQDDALAVLIALANRELGAYSFAPDALTIKPDDDRGQLGLPRLLVDYKVGGHVRGVAKKGYCRHRVPARVIGGTLRNAGKTVQTDLNVIPVVGLQADVADE